MHSENDPTDVIGRAKEVVEAGFPERYEGVDGTIDALEDAIENLRLLGDSQDEENRESVASSLIFAAGAAMKMAISIDTPGEDDDEDEDWEGE